MKVDRTFFQGHYVDVGNCFGKFYPAVTYTQTREQEVQSRKSNFWEYISTNRMIPRASIK